MHLRQLLQNLPSSFQLEQLMEELGLKKSSAIKLCQRYVKAGIFIRIRKNFYVFHDAFLNFSFDQKLTLSHDLRPETFISLRTALEYHGIVNRTSLLVQAVGLQNSAEFKADFWRFKYYKFPKKYCFSWVKKSFFNVASPEKALLDIFYLQSLGRYEKGTLRVRRDLLSRQRMDAMSKAFPKGTRKLVEQFWKRTAYPSRIRSSANKK